MITRCTDSTLDNSCKMKKFGFSIDSSGDLVQIAHTVLHRVTELHNVDGLQCVMMAASSMAPTT